ncbi:MAG: D-glycerate dehydrogenase [Chloroflexi bacterium]|nr:D-glycerate dehydrogenase [Chloroflexota bacterium]MCL5075986.1 D-glycerate dehydrogenase [Chloroflexota bacterium]
MTRVLTILKHWGDADLEQRQVGTQGRVVSRSCTSHAELVAAVQSECDVLLANGTVPLDQEIFGASERLGRVICYDVGPLTWVDLDAATRYGVVVAQPRTRSQNAVAEYTLALIFTLARHLASAIAVGRAGGWPKEAREHLRGFELQGKVLGVVGLGRIGQLVAEKASGLGLRVVAHSPHTNQGESTVPLLSLPDLLRQADFVSLHARLLPDNHGLIGEAELRQMKPTALLVNTARGALVDEHALVHALREGWIAGAALDVLTDEPPLQDHPLLRMDNVIITPHVAWNTIEVCALENEDLKDELRRAVSGQVPLHCANPEAIGGRKEVRRTDNLK